MAIDLNCDLGEGFGVWRLGDDTALLDIVTSANVACGFHAGDPSIMREVCELAVERNVVIGAQVSYRDLAGFGRRRIDVDPDTLTDEVMYQLGALDAFARHAGDRVRYVKPHGALYNTAVNDIPQAAAVVEAVRRFDSSLPILGMPDSRLLGLAESAGLTPVAEGFADRGYTETGRLVPRDHPQALLRDQDAVDARVRQLAVDGVIESVDGKTLQVAARSVCVHGDTPGAVAIARRIRQTLDAHGVAVTAFAR